MIIIIIKTINEWVSSIINLPVNNLFTYHEYILSVCLSALLNKCLKCSFLSFWLNFLLFSWVCSVTFLFTQNLGSHDGWISNLLNRFFHTNNFPGWFNYSRIGFASKTGWTLTYVIRKKFSLIKVLQRLERVQIKEKTFTLL
jgi:hypothetical protein